MQTLSAVIGIIGNPYLSFLLESFFLVLIVHWVLVQGVDLYGFTAHSSHISDSYF